MANQGGGYSYVFSFGNSPQNNLNIPPPPPPPPHPPVVYNTNPISTPPLSAIDRFLASDHEIINTAGASQNNNNMLSFDQNYLQVPYDSNNFVYENRHSGPNNNLSSRADQVSNNNSQGTYDFFMTESQIRNWEKSVGQVINGDEEMRRWTSNQSGRQKKRSRARGSGNSSNIIKGQWTADEDRKLLSLMHRFGDKKWAQISEEMYRRSGKQCRERWQNHLRPDIKKNGWTEVEEKMLIEAHQRLGNKWAEIAKRIPGRSENSIKNHWNATKRRQFTKRKNRIDNEASKNCVLLEYIKDKLLKATNQNSVNPTSTQANSNLDDPFSNFGIPTFLQSASEDSASLIEPVYDEDMNNFMQSLFGSNDNNINSPNLVDELGQLLNDGNLHSSSNTIENGTMMNTASNTIQQNVQFHGNFSNEDVAPLQPMDASRVSGLLDEVYSTPYLDYCYDGTPCIDKVHQQQQQLMNDQAEASSSSGTDEMDLIDLVLANFHYPE